MITVKPYMNVVANHVQPTRRLPARGRGEEERVEQHVRRAEVRGAAAGHEERDRDGGVHAEVVLRDRVRRALPTRR